MKWLNNIIKSEIEYIKEHFAEIMTILVFGSLAGFMGWALALCI